MTGPSIPPRYQTDAFRAHRGSLLEERGPSPLAVVLPRTAAEVATVVRFALDAGLKLVPWGGGTGLMGGARPSSDSIVLDLREMRRVRAIDPISGTVTVEAGMGLEAGGARPPRARAPPGTVPWSRA